ncbi:MAG: META domain-containing protein [Dysgonamonadaceae bacterium]|jgi:heat shock protein HslJ|nr:META domain-containing protein [Dysgonamonadaceae bacterium]
MKTIYFRLIICFILLLTIGACSTFFNGASFQATEIEEPVKNDSIIMRCKVNYVKVNAVEKMYFPYMGKISTLSLNYNENYAGFASCNRFFGKYTIDGQNISFQYATSTSVACSEYIIEKAVFTALYNVNNYTIKDKQLLLKRDDEILIVYDIE